MSDLHRRSLLLALLLAPALRAQQLEIIELKHRTADDVLPNLRAFLEPGGALTGQGYQLFVRASAANARQLKQLLATLDRAQLSTTVRGRLGEWIPVGGADVREQTGSASHSTQRGVWLKVDAVDSPR